MKNTLDYYDTDLITAGKGFVLSAMLIFSIKIDAGRDQPIGIKETDGVVLTFYFHHNLRLGLISKSVTLH
jgi:hypothetical protein